jgi:invasion protein IalB
MISPPKTKSGATAFGLAAAALIFLAGSALAQLAQPKPPAPRPAPAKPAVQAAQPVAQPAGQAAPPMQGDAPQQTTATYGDWVVQCELHSGETVQTCDMAQVQVAQVQGKNTPFSRVAIGKPDKGQPEKLIVQVPINVSFATNVRIQTSDDDPGLATPFATCTPNGCFALFDLKDDILKKLRAGSNAGALSFADSSGHVIKVPISFNGFGQAYEALAKK